MPIVTKSLYNSGNFYVPQGVHYVNVSVVQDHQFRAAVSSGGSNLVHQALLNQYGQMYSWGSNATVGVGSNTGASNPTLVIGNLTWQRFWLPASSECRFGLTTSGDAYAWGTNSFGQLGTGISPVTTLTFSSPTIVSGGHKFVCLFPGYFEQTHYGLEPGGNLYGWGLNSFKGQVGNNSLTDVSAPVFITSQVQHMFLWNFASYTIHQDGSMRAWGDNSSGQLGTGQNPGTTSAVSTPTVVSGPSFEAFARYTQYHRELGHAQVGTAIRAAMFAWARGGALYSWGDNSLGFLGVNSSVSAISTPTIIGGQNWTNIWIDDHARTCFAINDAGALYGWGSNANGQLCQSPLTTPSVSSPILVTNLRFQKVRAVAGSVFGLTYDGQLYSWGNNAGLGGAGILGQGNPGTVGSAVSTPTTVAGPSPFREFFFNGFEGWALGTGGFTGEGGNLFGWGNNVFGVLGTNDTVNYSSPVLVQNNVTHFWGQNFQAGTAHSLSPLGNVYSWGTNSPSFQLGNASIITTQVSVPVVVAQSNPGGGGANVNPQPPSTQQIPVLPGRFYQVIFGPNYTSVGYQIVGGPFVSRVDITYQL